MTFRDPFTIDCPTPPWFEEYYDEDEQRVYRLLKDAMLNNECSVELESCSLSIPELECIFRDVMSDNPLFFNYVGCNFRYDYDYYEVNLKLGYKAELYNLYRDMVRSKIEDLYYELGICALRSDFEIELAVNDWIVENCTWHRSFGSPFKPSREFYSLLGILLDGKGVCASVAATVNVLLNSFGVECHTLSGKCDVKGVPDPCILMDQKDLDAEFEVTSESCYRMLTRSLEPEFHSDGHRKGKLGYYLNNNHAWNYVHVGDEYLHLDVTFNMDGKYSFFNVPTDRLKGRVCNKVGLRCFYRVACATGDVHGLSCNV